MISFYILDVEYVEDIIDKTALAVQSEEKVSFDYRVGTMIELPRAALQAAPCQSRHESGTP